MKPVAEKDVFLVNAKGYVLPCNMSSLIMQQLPFRSVKGQLLQA